MALPSAFLDDVRARTSLVTVIGRRVKLQRAGREWKACCPFHNERTPSFFVNEEKGFYHCFSCGAHGDAITFLMEHDGLAFLAAVESLASEAGLAMPRPDADPRTRQRASLHKILEAAIRWFEAALRDTAGADARAYLHGRHVSGETARRFALGYAPPRQEALHHALAQAFPGTGDKELLAAGLTGTSADGRVWPRFRDRLLFPIHDSRGRPVGFGARTLGDAQPKYLNSAEGPLFDKGRLLYNLHRAAPPARKAQQLLIVEGYMDVVALAGAGFDRAVAPLGTALTPEQIALAWRVADVPTIAFDGDAAGIRAGHRAALRALPLLAPGKSLAFAALPGGLDPDELVQKDGAAAITTLLDAAKPLAVFLYDAERAAQAPLATPERRAAFLKRLDELAAMIADDTIGRDYRQTWRDRFYREKALARGARTKGDAPTPALRPETRVAAAHAGSTDILASILSALEARPGAAARHQEQLLQFPMPTPALQARLERLFDDRPASRLEGARAEVLRPAFAASLPDREFDDRIRRTLAALAELHHIEREMGLRDCADGDSFARELERRASLGAARAGVLRRLAQWAMDQGG